MGKLALLQFRHKAHTAQIDPQDGHAAGIGVLGRVEDGPIPAKADEHVRVLQFLLGVQKADVSGQLHIGALHLKRQTHGGLHPGVFQNALGGLGRLDPTIPVGVGAEYHFHALSPSSAS